MKKIIKNIVNYIIKWYFTNVTEVNYKKKVLKEKQLKIDKIKSDFDAKHGNIRQKIVNLINSDPIVICENRGSLSEKERLTAIDQINTLKHKSFKHRPPMFYDVDMVNIHNEYCADINTLTLEQIKTLEDLKAQNELSRLENIIKKSDIRKSKDDVYSDPHTIPIIPQLVKDRNSKFREMLINTNTKK